MDTLPRLDNLHQALVTQIKGLIVVACDDFHYKDGVFSGRIKPHMDAIGALSVLLLSDRITPVEEAAFRYAHSAVKCIYAWPPGVEDSQFFRLMTQGLLALQSLTMIFSEYSAHSEEMERSR
ncbi:hypothetical protein MMC07_005027 [Pseudocyphellaria aurata]|nr:hypothetical protein [Pseudocyphellaria aurata]